jgi:hypothetical protein
MTSRFVAAAVAALTVCAAASTAAVAQDKMGDKKMGRMQSGKMMQSGNRMKGVYVCRECNMAYTPRQARRMGMKDSMGHKLVKMDRLPAGMKMAPASGKMSGGKRMGSRSGGGQM